jgi:excisionase family DNA binding protein
MSNDLAHALVRALEPDDLEALAERLRPLLGLRAPEDDDDLLTADEAAEMLRCKRQRIYDLRHQGELRAFRDGRRVLFRRSDVRAFLRARADQPAA